jgi:hypothetical protein
LQTTLPPTTLASSVTPSALCAKALALLPIPTTTGINCDKMVSQVNGSATPATAAQMDRVFPEARQTLAEADPELYAIVKDEERRQW